MALKEKVECLQECRLNKPAKSLLLKTEEREEKTPADAESCHPKVTGTREEDTPQDPDALVTTREETLETGNIRAACASVTGYMWSYFSQTAGVRQGEVTEEEVVDNKAL